MLAIAQQTLEPGDTALHFVHLDLMTRWVERFAETGLDAVTSSMAIHHAGDKQALFCQVFAVLKPEGVFVFADHMAGASAHSQHLIDRERALVRLGRDQEDPEQILEAIRLDEEWQRVEGNLCESVVQYQHYLAVSGFKDIDCLWRDYWLAVIVARKPA